MNLHSKNKSVANLIPKLDLSKIKSNIELESLAYESIGTEEAILQDLSEDKYKSQMMNSSSY